MSVCLKFGNCRSRSFCKRKSCCTWSRSTWTCCTWSGRSFWSFTPNYIFNLVWSSPTQTVSPVVVESCRKVVEHHNNRETKSLAGLRTQLATKNCLQNKGKSSSCNFSQGLLLSVNIVLWVWECRLQNKAVYKTKGKWDIIGKKKFYCHFFSLQLYIGRSLHIIDFWINKMAIELLITPSVYHIFFYLKLRYFSFIG